MFIKTNSVTDTREKPNIWLFWPYTVWICNTFCFKTSLGRTYSPVSRKYFPLTLLFSFSCNKCCALVFVAIAVGSTHWHCHWRTVPQSTPNKECSYYSGHVTCKVALQFFGIVTDCVLGSSIVCLKFKYTCGHAYLLLSLLPRRILWCCHDSKMHIHTQTHCRQADMFVKLFYFLVGCV